MVIAPIVRAIDPGDEKFCSQQCTQISLEKKLKKKLFFKKTFKSFKKFKKFFFWGTPTKRKLVGGPHSNKEVDLLWPPLNFQPLQTPSADTY